MGATPLENNTSEATAVTLRNAASSYVASVASLQLKFINLGGSFDRTQVTTYYVTSDATGNHVHFNDSGDANVAMTAIAGVTSQAMTIPQIVLIQSGPKTARLDPFYIFKRA